MHMYNSEPSLQFLLLLHTLLYLHKYHNYYEMKFQLLKVSSNCEVLTLKLVHTYRNLRVPRVQVAS